MLFLKNLLFALSILSMLFSLCFCGRHYLHMFQLSSYYQKRFFKWQAKNVKAKNIVFAAIASALMALELFGVWHYFPTALIVCLSLLSVLLHKAPPQKKKLVYTSRVKRQIGIFFTVYAVISALAVTGVFFENTVSLVACLILTLTSFIPAFWIFLSGVLNVPLEKCVQRGFVKDAERIMASMKDLTVVGITGSYGKTSSKYILNAVLSEKYNTLMTPESYNTLMGVVKTIRTSLSPLHQIFIAEMGAKHVGEIKEIAELVRPSVSMITTVGVQHLESFGSEENIQKAKFEIVGALRKGGKAVLNYDCDKIRNYNTYENTVTFGFSSERDYYAKDIRCTDKGTEFTLCTKDGREIRLVTKLLGEHNVMNIVSAAAIGIELGVTEAQLVRACARLTPAPHRLELKNLGTFTMIDNAFNSNPEGARQSLKVLSTFEGYTKVIVTPGFIELGALQKEKSFEFGRQIAKTCDAVILVGKAITADIRAGIESEGFGGFFETADTLNEALTLINKINGDKKAVLFENDLPDNYEPQKK